MEYGVVRGLGGNFRRHRIDCDNPAGIQLAQARDNLRVGQQDLHTGVGEDVSHAVGRKFRIERHIAGAGLEHGEQGHEQPRAASDADAHQRAWHHADLDQMMRELVGACVEVAIAQRVAAEFQCRPVRPFLGLPLEELVQQARRCFPHDQGRAFSLEHSAVHVAYPSQCHCHRLGQTVSCGEISERANQVPPVRSTRWPRESMRADGPVATASATK